jgi:hypothetical protein
MNNVRPPLAIHPAALAFPEMLAIALQELADDIKQNGLAHPIVRNGDGLLLDGRNRLKACEIAGVEPRFETYKGTNPVGFIVSSNLKRRHLNESQRALIGAKLAKLSHGGDRRSNQAANLPLEIKQATAAALLNVSERSVRHAAVVRDSGKPDLIKKVEQGELSVSAAAKKARPKPKPDLKPQPVISITPIRSAFQRLDKAAASGNVRRVQEHLRELLQAVKEALK